MFGLLAPGFLAAQAPLVGVIDFYGLRRVTEKSLRAALGVREGDRMPPSKGDLEERLEHVSGVVRAHVQAVCCAGDRAILYVGIEEKGAPHFDYLPEPDGDVVLPEPIVDSYRHFLAALAAAARAGPVSENVAQGHELSTDPAARAFQERFRALAAEHLDLLRLVLRESGDAFQRACAAYVIGYVPTKRLVINDLQDALRDPDESVRANAIRSLGAIAALAVRSPDLAIRVEPTWFVEMLNSIVWSDRVRAAGALVPLTEQRSPYVLDQLRERALPSLAEMARWKTLDQALPAFLLLGRLAGLREAQIYAAWTGGDRDTLIERALKR